jgi:hypothetical protein
LRLAVIRLEERLAPATFVATRFTDGTGPGTLRWAILQADQTPGSNTVDLRPGTYTLTLTGGIGAPGQTGALVVQGNVTIAGAGPHKTRVNAGALGDRAFHVTSGNVTFSDLTITGGHAAQGGGILIDTGNVKIVHCVLATNVAAGIDGGKGQGGALYQSAGSLDVSNTAVTGNSAQGGDAPSDSVLNGGSGEGGGFYLSDSVTAHLARDTFTGNSAQGGRGPRFSPDTGGFAGGGAIRAIGDSLTITESSFANNRATGGAGADAEIATTGGQASGGAISVQSSATLVLTHSALSDNQALGGTGGNGPLAGDGGEAQGGGIYAAFGSTISASADVIAENAAVGGNAGADGVNSAQHLGGAGNGGAIFCFVGTSSTLTHSTVLNNVAQGGRGGDGTYGGPGGNGAGGGVMYDVRGGVTATTFSARGDTFAGNRSVGGAQGMGTTANGRAGSASGGAVNVGPRTTATLDGTVFKNNRASGPGPAGGGAITSVFASVALTRDIFSGNIAAGGAGSFGAGGAINANQQSTLTAMCVTFVGNAATGGASAGDFPGGFGQGGAVAVFQAQASFRGSVLKANSAAGGAAGAASAGDAQGGAIDTIGGTLDLTRATLAANRATGGAGSASASGGSGQGGALFNNPASSLTVKGAAIERNKALGSTGFGGGIYLTGGGQPALTHVRFAGNVATTAGPDIFPSSAGVQQGKVTDVTVIPATTTSATGNTASVKLIYNPGELDKRTITINVDGPGRYILNQTADGNWGVINNSGKPWKRFVLTLLKSPDVSGAGPSLISSKSTNGKLPAKPPVDNNNATVVTFSSQNPNEWVPSPLFGSRFELKTVFSTKGPGTITITEQPFLS